MPVLIVPVRCACVSYALQRPVHSFLFRVCSRWCWDYMFSVWMIFSSLPFIFVNTNMFRVWARLCTLAKWNCPVYVICVHLWEDSVEKWVKQRKQTGVSNIQHIYMWMRSRTFAHSHIHHRSTANHLMNHIYENDNKPINDRFIERTFQIQENEDDEESMNDCRKHTHRELILHL